MTHVHTPLIHAEIDSGLKKDHIYLRRCLVEYLYVSIKLPFNHHHQCLCTLKMKAASTCAPTEKNWAERTEGEKIYKRTIWLNVHKLPVIKHKYISISILHIFIEDRIFLLSIFAPLEIVFFLPAFLGRMI